jgi:hypothetical protein
MQPEDKYKNMYLDLMDVLALVVINQGNKDFNIDNELSKRGYEL